MQILHPKIAEHLRRLAATRDPILLRMERIAWRRGFPIIGPEVGALLWQLAMISKARRILELGSGFGYSASWLARGLARGGQIICTDTSQDNADEATIYFRRQRIQPRIRFLVGDALGLIDRLPGTFDLILNDVDKEDYPRAFRNIVPRLRRGGILVSDNMLWDGRVVQEERSPSTRGILRYTGMLYGSNELLTTLLPLGDGLAVSVKLR
jgi:predicted O-methyltransferase YrrM